MNTRIPDEVIREIEAEASKYTICIHEGVDAQYCCCSSREEFSFQDGAQAFYLKGEENMAKRIVEWIREIEKQSCGPGTRYLVTPEPISAQIEAKFLKESK